MKKNSRTDTAPPEFRLFRSPLGVITLAGCGEFLTGVEFRDQSPSALPAGSGHTGSSLPVLKAAEQWLERYFAGEDPGETPPIHLTGTPFRLAVWEQLRRIPRGETTTYGAIAAELARQLGIPRMSAQAVGGAVGHNPVGILIPCHRVVGSDGNLTGFASGLRRKFRLLALEGLDMSQYPLPPPRGGSDLRQIPGVGPNIEQDLFRIGIRRIADLAGEDPEQLYRDDCAVKKFQEDRCQLYVFRLAVYFAEHPHPEPEKLRWHWWKDHRQ